MASLEAPDAGLEPVRGRASQPRRPRPAEAEFYAEEGEAEAAAGKKKVSSGEDIVEASIVKDGELGVEVLEMIGRGGIVRLTYNTECALPFLVLQIKDIGRFCSVEVTFESTDGQERTLTLSSKASVARVAKVTATLPLMLRQESWNYCCLDVEDLAFTAFGSKLSCTTRVVVASSCRVARVFFQDKRYEDRELPAFLRVIT